MPPQIRQYWMFPRPHRKLIRVPKSLGAFAGVAAGRHWQGARDLQIQYEDRLVELDLKRQGDSTERDRGRGGSGGRTHAQLLYALGLFFYYQSTEDAIQEVHFTLSGQKLIDQEDALPVLRKQVLSHQFPSAYSTASSVNIDRRFKVRPFIVLLKLLRHQDLDNYLTDDEIAACVIGEATSHKDTTVNQLANTILEYRNKGLAALPPNFRARMNLPRSLALKTTEQLVNGPLKDIANTAVQWLRYTGYATEAKIWLDDGPPKTVTTLNKSLLDEIDEAISYWSQKPLIQLPEPSGKFERAKANAAFQRTYGVSAGMTKDQRNIGALRQASENDLIAGLVSSALNHHFSTSLLTEVTQDVVDAVVRHTGLTEKQVNKTLENIISSKSQGVDAFLDRYEQMAFSGQEEAINFEKATTEVLIKVFGLNARHVGQSGSVPDVETWSSNWAGIIDTKAYSAYDLPHDHQLRMSASYVPKYSEGINGKPLKFFMYLAGGFAPSFESKLRTLSSKTEVPGCGMTFRAWRNLIVKYESGAISQDSLLDLWSSGDTVGTEDIIDLVMTSASQRGAKFQRKHEKTSYEQSELSF
ncbi:AlwI family type II restriction endonuclease [Auritidibacter ignavus]|uniref:AlwI family type II restriction endonuclease n=1 Tax=Auritidibacter ignavus TaxID=678932 RepID=UPI00109C48CC|nr:AlwI family type II restriction endonuclease [Auritidibacter ignavus]